VGAEKGGHLRSHPFFVVNEFQGPIFRAGWDREEEALLIRAIRSFGIGGWRDIAGCFQQHNNHVEIETHFLETYVRSPTAPFPLVEVLPPVTLPPPPNFDTTPVESAPSDRSGSKLREKGRTVDSCLTLAEQSEWMPFRHEFEHTFESPAENIVADLVFESMGDDPVSFEAGVESLLAYNTVLAERQRRTEVIEEWELQSELIRKPNDKLNKDGAAKPILDGSTVEEKEINRRIAPLTPYMGKQKVIEFGKALGELMKCNARIAQFHRWECLGISGLREGHLHDQLREKIQQCQDVGGNLEGWNEIIARYVGKTAETTESADVLLREENALCTDKGIDPHSFFVIKDLLIREYAIFGALPRDAIGKLAPACVKDAEIVYDFLLENGIIGE
jgi:transcriptional adapter 2-alpha